MRSSEGVVMVMVVIVVVVGRGGFGTWSLMPPNNTHLPSVPHGVSEWAKRPPGHAASGAASGVGAGGAPPTASCASDGSDILTQPKGPWQSGHSCRGRRWGVEEGKRRGDRKKRVYR